jgi:hypothetical protein
MKSFMNSRTIRALGQRARIARVIVAVALAGIFTAACGSSTDLKTVSSLTLTPTTATLALGGTQQFTAVAKASDGSVLAVTPAWSVVAGGGTISQSGLFTAGAVAGTFTNTVTVICSGLTATATIIVTPGVLATITVTPNPATLATGAAQTFTAVGRDASNNVIAITPVWSVAAGGGTIVAGTGVFTAGLVTGTFTNTVVATSGALSGRATVIVTGGPVATITVTPNPATVATGATQQFTAVGTDANNNIVPITPVWSVTNSGGTIVAGTGLFTAGALPGTFINTVRATSGAIFGTATVNVTSASPPALNILGTASLDGILAGTTVTCITGGVVNADIGISPGSALVGFGPCIVTGVKHLADGVAAQAQLDLTVAYNTLFGLPCPPANAIVADLGGTTKPAGVYCTASGIGVTGTLTLDGGGDPNSTFVFQAGTSLVTAGSIVLINGAQAKNVWWQVGTSATLGTASQWQGNILALSSITLVDNATLLGRALARNGAVTLGTNNVITLP